MLAVRNQIITTTYQEAVAIKNQREKARLLVEIQRTLDSVEVDVGKYR